MFEEVVSMFVEEEDVNMLGEVDIVNMFDNEEDSVNMLTDLPESAMLRESLLYNLKQQNINHC